MRIKQCFNPDCSIKYREDMDDYNLDNCTKCGAPIIFIECDENFNNFSNPNSSSDNINNYMNKDKLELEKDILTQNNDRNVIFKLSANGEIIVTENEEINFDLTGPRLIIYSGVTAKDVYEIKYDEVVIGRRNVSEIPDIDLSIYDRNNITSRRHALVYKLRDRFYVRNESSKNSLHVNKKAIAKGEDFRLENGDLIILSRSYVLQFLE